MPGIGKATPIRIDLVEAQRGLGRIEVELVQGDLRHTLAEEVYTPRPFWVFWGPMKAAETLQITVGKASIPGLREGEAQIVVTSERAGTWIRRPAAAQVELTLPVRLKPPQLSADSAQTYVAQGGSSVVLYRSDEHAVRDGVQVGPHWFPGYPLPGDEGRRFALFGTPHDQTSDADIHLVAEDALGNRAEVAIVDRFLSRPVNNDTINLSDAFLERVVPPILEQSSNLEAGENPLASYLLINGELRQRNSNTLRDLAKRSQEAFLWDRPFKQLPNTQSMASFADHRTYLYQGKEVDQQDHLGFDLASFRRAPVLAANSGVVLLAEYFGIYGNTVVIDHGYGLMSLYAHLSSISVSEDQKVRHGEEVGRTGQTGLAGGDHLHFSMLLHGLQINPLEWWDPQWTRDRIVDKLGTAIDYHD
jgi:murein DD-endopeptidase MepM/ murein hydrolase activator NlpD